jgi:hypothetical protein
MQGEEQAKQAYYLLSAISELEGSLQGDINAGKKEARNRGKEKE